MTRYSSQTQVGGGYYFNTTSFSMHTVDGDRGELPGEASTSWIRLPAPLLVIAVLTMSLLFVVFVPVIGLALVARALAGAARDGLARGAQGLAQTFSPQWRPGEAWLTRPAKDSQIDQAARPPELDELRRQVDERRADEDKS